MIPASITWLGHSAFRLTLADERVILIDPWLKENPACPEHLKKPDRCDFIVCTHGHPDHVGDVTELSRNAERINHNEPRALARADSERRATHGSHGSTRPNRVNHSAFLLSLKDNH